MLHPTSRVTGERQSFRAGDRVHIRGERWRVLGQHPHALCSILEVAGTDPSNRGALARFILPFERALPLSSHDECPRIARAPVLRHAMRRALATATPTWTCLRAAANAQLSLLPFQLEPAVAMTRGISPRILLADAVGLGKTIQAGLILAEILAREPDARTLIVTPAGLREQWRDELAERFAIAADIFDAAGVARAVARLPSGLNPWSLPPVVISSIDFVKRPDVIRALETLVWDLVVFDEAHGLVGRSDRAAAAGLLAARGRRVLLLTATPHSGDDRAFARLCELGALEGDGPILMFRRGRDEAGRSATRRTRMLDITPTPAERWMHRELDAYARRVWREVPAGCAGGARLAMGVLARRACSSPAALARSIERRLALLSGAPPPVTRQLDLPLDEDRELADMEPAGELGTPGLPSLDTERRHLERIRLLAGMATAAESKIEALRRFLRRVHEPAIVFTEYRDTLARLAHALQAEDEPQLHGGMDAAERKRQLRRFTHGDARLLLATDAASEGLNLHRRCRIVVNLEVPWTPMRFEQRVGRVDRLGQPRRAHAVTLVARDTVEESVAARFVRRLGRVLRATPYVPAETETLPATIPDGVRVVSLRAEATAEAQRLTQLLAMRDPGGKGPDLSPGAPAARYWSRPPAAILGTARGNVSLYWALRLQFVDEQDALVWDTVAAATAVRRLNGPVSAREFRQRLDVTTRELAGGLACSAACSHAQHLDRLRHEIREATSGTLRRERAIAAHLRLTMGRLARPLVQAGLFDRRAIRRADAQRRLSEEALGRSADRISRLERLLSPREGERTLLFVAGIDA